MKVHLVFSSFYKDRLQDQLLEVVSLALHFGLTISGPIPLPRKRHRFTVNRSPHVNKKSREQFQVTRHRQLLVLSGDTGYRCRTFSGMVEAILIAGVGLRSKILLVS